MRYSVYRHFYYFFFLRSDRCSTRIVLIDWPNFFYSSLTFYLSHCGETSCSHYDLASLATLMDQNTIYFVFTEFTKQKKIEDEKFACIFYSVQSLLIARCACLTLAGRKNAMSQCYTPMRRNKIASNLRWLLQVYNQRQP